MVLDTGTVLGRYRVGPLIGRGATGVVYEAQDERLGRRVALKVLHPDLAADPVIRDRFVGESRIVASLDHPHVIPVFDADEVDGYIFIAMRLVPGGRDLDVILREAGRLDPVRAATLVEQVGAALDAAHGAGLVHRDVKPGNVLVAHTATGEEHAYLCDFGLARSLSAMSASLSGSLHGTIGYIAPEVIEGRHADARADVYSLGCMLYELVTGETPFRRENEVAVLFAQVNGEAPEPTSIDPDLPSAIDEVIRVALAPDPDERIQSAGELGRLAHVALVPIDGAPASATRGFLFADLRGYTAFVEEHGDGEAARLLERYRQMVRSVVARHSGAEIRTEGDSFYVVFPSVTRAVKAGLDLVAEAARRSQLEPAYLLHVGVGVNAGESVETSEGPVGSAVNLAARVCSVADAGEVLVSDTVRGLVRTHPSLRFEAVGARQLKGITDPVPLFRAMARDAVGSPGDRKRALPPSAGRSAAPRRRRLSRPLILSATGVLLVASVAVAALAILQSSSPGEAVGSPGPSPQTVTADPAAAEMSAIASSPPVAIVASDTFPTTLERDLLERLPSDLAVTCSRTAPGTAGAGGQVGVVCEQALGAQVDMAWFDIHEPAEGAGATFFRIMEAAGVPPGDCDAEPPVSAHDRWQIGASLSGERACYLRDGAAWVVWTNPASGLLGKATRGDGDLGELLAWWNETAPFIR